jgi:hypothetical protein
LNQTSTIRRSQRLIAAAILISLSSALAGCGSMSGYDPTDLLDFLDTKKKLPGERKPVFPEGVPGLEQGVPKDLYKGASQQQQSQDIGSAPPPVEEPKSKRAAGKGKNRQPTAAGTAPGRNAARAPVAAPETDVAPDEEGSTAAAPPAPPPKKIVRRRTTAPPPDQPAQAARSAPQPAQSAPQAQQSAAPAQQSAFPAPLPSGTFSR